MDASPIGRWNRSREQLKGQIELFDLWMNEETVTLVRFPSESHCRDNAFCEAKGLVEPRRIELLTS
ncbi:hypothetical protein TRM7557_02232 [Tritonibacter multivorans]|uniref:Uncharacterized protein n=1 Tax=Tritonibacter multivorans TaxID=928856 RepID=A0A0N7M012_9RHOB|nr:hypothetical protein TRM7557_02232 [Tritonibacter multivorans]